MKGDFTRDTFLAANHYSRVLFQQGRVQLDADINEQVSILLHYLQTLAADMIGQHGGFEGNCGFEISEKGNVYLIGKGHYYVDGILCEVEVEDGQEGILYSEHAEKNRLPQEIKFPALFYLDVWERLITHHQSSDYPSMREVALNGADTSARAKIVWQVRQQQVNEGSVEDSANLMNRLKKLGNAQWNDPIWTEVWEAIGQSKNRGKMMAWCKPTTRSDEDNACIVPPDSVYSGAENQLYRVEIHEGGKAEEATFKWSRDNGSIVFPIQKTDAESNTVFVSHLGRDDQRGLKVGDWVEIVDDLYELANDPDAVQPLFQISAVDRQTRMVKLTSPKNSSTSKNDYKVTVYTEDEVRTSHPLLRRWDHIFSRTDRGRMKEVNGAIQLVEDQELLLENHITIQFEPSKSPEPAHKYYRGDYWLIPARTVAGDIEWPQELSTSGSGTLVAKAIPPHGMTHHYAPLAYVSGDGIVEVPDKRHCINFSTVQTHTEQTESNVVATDTQTPRKHQKSNKEGL